MPRTTRRAVVRPIAKPIANRDAKIDAVHDFIAKHFRDLTIDAVLVQPAASLGMAVAIANDLGELRQASGRLLKIARDLARVAANSPADYAAVCSVLRAALRGRKAGGIRRDRH